MASGVLRGAGIPRSSSRKTTARGALLLAALLLLPVALPAVSSGALAAADWPQARQNAARTGLATAPSGIVTPSLLQTLTMPGPVATSPVVADLDGDGLNEVVVVSDFLQGGPLLTVRAFRASGGSLAEYWSFAIPVDPIAIPYVPLTGSAHVAVADLTGDGTPEVVVYSNYVLGAAACSTLACSAPSINDGRLTVLAGTTGAEVDALLNDVIVIGQPAAPVVGDVTGDGTPEIVLVRQTGGTGAAAGFYLLGATLSGSSLSVAFNTRLGTVSLAAPPALAELRSSHAGLELVAAEDGFSNGKVYLCKPASGNATCNESLTLTGTAVRGLAIGDLDADGALEIVANGRGSNPALLANSLAVVKTTGGALSLGAQRNDGFLWNTPSIGDVDGDGRNEVVNVQHSENLDDVKSGNVQVRGFTGAAITAEGDLARQGSPGLSTQSRAGGSLVDLDADGRPELVFGSGDGNLVAVRFSTASVPTTMWALPLGVSTTGAPFSAVAAGDVNGDAKADLVVGGADRNLYVLGAAGASVPGAPTALGATPGDGQVQLGWTAPAAGGSAITSYKVYRGTSPGTETFLADTGSTATAYTDTAVTNGVTYYYQISAVNAQGEGARSNEASATPMGAATAPGAPLGLQAKPGNASATLLWNAPATDGGSPVTSYKVYRGTTSGSLSPVASGGCSGLGNVLTCADAGLTNGVTYFYQVSAVNGIGEGPRSAEVSALPAPSSPLAFRNFPGTVNSALMSSSGEPGIGVNWNTGNVLMSAQSKPPLNIPPAQKQARIAFDDSTDPPTATFTDVTSPFSRGNIDPLLTVDPVTGRTMAGGWDGHCAILSYTDDDGQTWLPSADPCALPGVDHPTVGVGKMAFTTPPTPGVWPNITAPRIWYYCAQPGLTTGPAECWRSLDGGNVFAPIPPPWTLGTCRGLHGKLRVSEVDGAAYLPNKNCLGHAGFAVTTDNGLTWSIRTNPSSPGNGRFDPSVAPARSGSRVYFAQAEASGPFVGVTADKGLTWQDVGTGSGAAAGTKWFNLGNLVSPPVRRAEFVNVIAGDDDRAAVEFFGSTSSEGNSGSCNNASTHVWHMYVAVTYDGGTSWQVVRASTDPVQRGPFGDPDESFTSCRNHLDFNDMAIDARGRIVVGYADGCIATCAGSFGTVGQSNQAMGSVMRQSGGCGLLKAYDSSCTTNAPLAASAGGPYTATAGTPRQLAGGASGGTAPYTFSWSVAAKPAGSTAGAASFSNPNAQSPTFTADVAGAYTLTLTVQDSALGSVTTTAALTASAIQCQAGGTIVASDSNIDGGLAGSAAEALCLRMADNLGTVHFYLDLQGTALNNQVDSTHPLFYDFHFQLGHVEDLEPFLISVAYRPDGSVVATYNDPVTFGVIPGKQVQAKFEGNTLHVFTPRSEMLSPPDGAALNGVYVSINHCAGLVVQGLCFEDFFEDDLIPDGQDGRYVLNSSGAGIPLAECNATVVTDATTDTTATAGAGRREVVSVAASDTASDFSACVQVANFADAPGGTGTTSQTQYNVFFTAEYEGPEVAYALQSVWNNDGTLASASLFKGANLAGQGYQTFGALGGPATAKRVGDAIVMTAQKANLGRPPDGAQATAFVANARDNAGTAAFDRAPNTGQGATPFTFGQTTSDATPPSQVTGLTVTDPQTGSTLNLAWDAASDNVGVVRYDVQRGTASGGPYSTVGTPTSTTFTDTGLTTGTTYYYVVRARDAAGNAGPDSAEASGTPTAPADATPPTVPTDLMASGVTTTSATLGWSPSSDPESGVRNYNVYRDAALVGSPLGTSFTDSGLSPATTYTYTVTAVNNVDLESATSAPLGVTTLPPAAFVRITDPTSGEEVAPPTTFRGAFSTTGEEPMAHGGPLADAMPPELVAYASHPFVAGVLGSPAWLDTLGDLSTHDGFLTAYPSPEDGGVIVAQFTGSRPQDAPLATANGWQLRYQEDVQPQPVMAPVVEDHPERVYTLEQVEQMIADGSILNGAPPAPTPGVQQGIGPGTAIQIANFDTTAPAGVKTFACTASFLFENPATGRYYLATAGHCLQDTNSNDGTAATKSRWIRLCFRNCVNNAVTLGDYVLLEPNSVYPGYHPVAWAHQSGVGRDAGLIELPPSILPLVRPWMWFWGGPRAEGNVVPNDVGVHWGHGLATGTNFGTQGRAALVTAGFLTNPGAPNGFAALGAIYGGDSGSSFSKAAPRTDKVAVGDRASGILTHSSALPVVGGIVVQMFGNQMARSIDMWQNGFGGVPGLGFRPVLVTEDAVLRLPTEPPAPALAAAITSPPEGASLDPDATPTVTVAGTASFPPAAAAGTGTSTYYLHRSSPGGCAGTLERLWMDPIPSPTRESGTGCGSVRDPAGPVVEAAVNITAQYFPTAPPSRTASAIVLDPTRDVRAVVYLNASLNRTTNANLPPGYAIIPGASLVNDLEAYVTYEAGGVVKDVGRQRLFPGPMLFDTPTPVEFRFKPLVPMIPANANVVLTFVVHESITHLSTWYGGTTLSRLELPLGTVPGASVQVSVDDATFAPGSLLTVTGTTSWTAPWSLAGVANGAHTLYARAAQAGQFSAVATVNVTIAGAVGPTAAFTSSVAGLTATFADTSVAGSAPIGAWSWTFGDGGTSAEQHPTHTYAAAGTYTVALQVTDANGKSSTVAHDVEVQGLPEWEVQTRLTGPGGLVFDWTPVANPADGSNGFWEQVWAPTPSATPGTYTLEARLLKDGSAVSGDSVTFTVVDTNGAPVVDAGADQVADEGALVQLSGTAGDPDGDPLSIAWTQTAGPAVALSGADTLGPSFTAPDRDADATYTFQLTATDPGGKSASDSVSVLVVDASRILIETIDGRAVPLADTVSGTVPVAGSSSLAGGSGANQAPVAVISDVVVDGLTVSASGAGSFDPDGSIAGHAWSLGNGDTASGAVLEYTYDAAGTFVITLTVTDNQGAVGQAQVEVDVAPPPPGAFIVDAGDTQYVKVGTPVTLNALAFGNDEPVSFAWDTNGDGVADTAGQSIQVPTPGAGRRTFTVVATEAGTGRQAEDSVDALGYTPQVSSQLFEADVLVGVNDEDPGRSGQVDQATRSFDAVIPAGAELLDVTLRWSVFVNEPVVLGGGPNDFDLYAFTPGGAQDTLSAGFSMPERIGVAGPVPGTWRFEVRPYVVANDHYWLWVNTTFGPGDPAPIIDQLSPTCFETPTQQLEVGLRGAPAATTGWDLDFDGLFDDGTGLTATTDFPVDGSAHLVRFRAATADGDRTTILVALRVAASCPDAPSVVVVAVADTGINPYASEFAGELTPYPELRTYTTADLGALNEKDVPLYHRVTGELLPFTKHPSTYIPGFPPEAEALELTLGGGYYKGLDDAAVWTRGHEVVKQSQWMWIPGTKIVAAIDATDDAGQNGAPDPTPLWDDHGHGAASAGVAVGNTIGTCPRCVLAFVEGLNNEEHAERAPWIDFVSVSGSPRANVGFPDFGEGVEESVGRQAAERGQTISFAAGNGVANAFDVPEQTYLPSSNGPDWVLRVGAVQKTGTGTGATGGVVLGTGKPVDWSSYGAGNIPTACRNSYGPNCQHSGTSAATPIATGVMGAALLNARIAVGDAAAGQKAPEQAGGQRQAIAVGSALAGSPWLADGVLTRAELWNVAFHCASAFGAPQPIFGLGPASPVDWLYGGYGLANTGTITCATSALLAGGPVASRPEVDAFYAVDSALRQRFWGAWDADGDGQPGGLPTGFAAPDLDLGELTLDDLASDAKVSALWARAFGQLGAASPTVESYWLHHTGGCSGAAGERDFMDQTDSTGDDDGCGLAGGPPLVGELCCPSASFPSDVPSVGFATGATVAGTLYLDYVHPGAPIVTAVLLANGVEVGRAEMQPVALGGFGLLGFTPYPFAFVTLADVPAGATLQLDVYVAGSEAVFFGYEDDHASSFTITGSNGGGGGGELAAAITAPAQGASFDKSTTSSVAVTGTATFPPSSEPGRAWLRYDETDGACGPRYLSREDGPDLGNTCAKTFGIAGGLLGLFDDFPADFDPVQLQPGGRVTGKLYFNADGPSPGQVTVLLKGDGNTLGSQTVQFTVLGLGESVEAPVDFPLDGLTSTSAINDLVLEIHLEQQGPAQWVETEDPPSFVDLPFLSSPDSRRVEVSVDDAGFGAGSQLSVTGTESWSATWSLAGVPEGPHIIYARAVEGATVGPVSSVGVTVTGSDEPRVGSVQVQVVRAGSLPTPAGWAPADSYDTASGAWSFAWDTGAASNGFYDVHARLLGDGVEEARDVATAEVRNARAPVLAPIGPKTVDEDEELAFQVSASDPDGDALTFSAAPLPDGADFDPATRTFTWTPDFTQAGSYDVTFTVTDSQGDADSEAVTITVVNVNRGPSLAAIPDQSVLQGQTLSFNLEGADPDAEALTFSATNPPAGLAVDAATGAVSWTPGLGQAGSYQVTFEVRDPHGAAAQQVASIEVRNNPPSAAGGCSPTTTDRITAVACTDGSTDGEGAVQGWRWAFGDGSTSTEQNPSHTYASLGTFTVTLEVTDDNGATGSATVADITVLNLAPTAAGTAEPTETDRQTPVQFTDASTDDDGTIASWLWDFGDGTTSTEQNPTHTYSELGTKKVTLTVTDSDGATDDVEVAKIKVKNIPPRGGFHHHDGTHDRIEAVPFHDDTEDPDGSIVAWSWTFGDGATSAEQHPTHLYTSLGTFDVTLTVTDNDGDSYMARGEVEVLNLLPTAGGSSDRTDTDRLTAVLFSDASSDLDGTIASWLWKFGDGTTSAEQHPSHTYASLGTFAPTLTVTDNDGGQATAALGDITVLNLAPTPSGGSDRTSTDRLTAVLFTDASTDLDGTIASWSWGFGDGSTSTEQNPSHTYASLGTFAPTLTVMDSDGATATLLLPAITVFNLAPAPAGGSDRTSTDRLTAVLFTDASTDLDGTIASWSWAFGDGSTSTEQNPSHTYASLGTFAPIVTVTDNDGDSASLTLPSITVLNLVPSAAFTRTPGDANRVDPVQFTDASGDPDGSIASWLWEFGDGNSSTEQSPAHTYRQLGTFTVRLTVTDNDGDSASAEGAITVVNLAPTPDFTVDPSDPMVLEPVMFEDASVDRDGAVQAWEWDFGDGMTSPLQDPSHVYLDGGVYVVRLLVTDNDGATAEAARQVVVCEPGGDLGTVVDPEHLHVELGGCVKVNAQDIVDGALAALEDPLGERADIPEDAFALLASVFDTVHELNEETLGLPGL